MASTPRKTLLQFGSSGPTSSFGQFGSLVAGAPINSKDPATIQALTAWLNGWQDAVFGANKAPLLEDMNGAMFVAFYQLFYLLEKGIPEWDANTTYYKNSYVRKSGDTNSLYCSAIDNNLGNVPTDNASDANWNFGPPVLASRIVGQIVDAQISGMSASKLIGLISSGQISSLNTSQLVGLILNAQISSMDGSKLTGSVPAALLSGSIPGSQIADGTITRGKLSTGTGFISQAGGSNRQMSMNDYSFFPSIETQTATDAMITFNANDSGDTVGRFGIGNLYQLNMRWRYMTASDNPRIWLIVNKDGSIAGAWESEDPPNQGDIENGYEEACPFNASTLLDGQRIVKVPVMTPDVLHNFFLALPKEVGEAIITRYHKVIEAKGWLEKEAIKGLMHVEDIAKAVASHKKDMAVQWFLRHICGRTNVANVIRMLCEYSTNDGRIYLIKEAIDKVLPTHIEI